MNSAGGDGGEALMILVAGPYRSGTGDDPARMAANVRAMEAYALPLFRAGHVPVAEIERAWRVLATETHFVMRISLTRELLKMLKL